VEDAMRTHTLPTVVVAAAILVVAAGGSASAGKLTPPPVWENGALLGPAKQAAESVRGTFSYDTATQKLTIKLGAKSVIMKRGSTSATANGQAITLPVAPKVLNGTTYVPLKSLFGGLGMEIKPQGTNAWILCSGKSCYRLEVPPRK
jgi:hypothetical protein